MLVKTLESCMHRLDLSNIAVQSQTREPYITVPTYEAQANLCTAIIANTGRPQGRAVPDRTLVQMLFATSEGRGHEFAASFADSVAAGGSVSKIRASRNSNVSKGEQGRIQAAVASRTSLINSMVSWGDGNLASEGMRIAKHFREILQVDAKDRKSAAAPLARSGGNFELDVVAAIGKRLPPGWIVEHGQTLSTLLSAQSHKDSKAGKGLKQEADVIVRDENDRIVGVLEVKLAAQNPISVIYGDLHKYAKLLGTLTRASLALGAGRERIAAGTALHPIYVISDEALRKGSVSAQSLVDMAARGIYMNRLKQDLARHIATCCKLTLSENKEKVVMQWDRTSAGSSCGGTTMSAIVSGADAATAAFFRKLSELQVYVLPSSAVKSTSTRRTGASRGGGPSKCG